MSDFLEDCEKEGLFDSLNSSKYFIACMKDRNLSTLEFYLSGIKMLDSWYGDKAYRQYYDWFDVLDRLFMQAENYFKGRFGND